MATTAQIEANRRNAQHSTGPRTEDGRARSSQNSVKHGVFSKRPVIPGEHIEEYEQHQAAFAAACRPADAVQLALVDQMADAEWKRRRIGRLEAGMFQRLYEREVLSEHKLRRAGAFDTSYPEDDQEQATARMSIATYRAEVMSNMFNRYARYEAHQVRTFHRSLQEFRKENSPAKIAKTHPISDEIPAEQSDLSTQCSESETLAANELRHNTKNGETNPISDPPVSGQQSVTLARGTHPERASHLADPRKAPPGTSVDLELKDAA